MPTVTKIKIKIDLTASTKLKLKLFHPFVTTTKLQLKPHSHLVYIPVITISNV